MNNGTGYRTYIHLSLPRKTRLEIQGLRLVKQDMTYSIRQETERRKRKSPLWVSVRWHLEYAIA